jgi:hypothetical protein
MILLFRCVNATEGESTPRFRGEDVFPSGAMPNFMSDLCSLLVNAGYRDLTQRLVPSTTISAHVPNPRGSHILLMPTVHAHRWVARHVRIWVDQFCLGVGHVPNKGILKRILDYGKGYNPSRTVFASTRGFIPIVFSLGVTRFDLLHDNVIFEIAGSQTPLITLSEK